MIISLSEYQRTHQNGEKKLKYLVDEKVFPQTIELLKTRSGPFGIDIVVGKLEDLVEKEEGAVGVCLQYPDRDGNVKDWSKVVEKTKQSGGLVSVATDLLALTVLKPPGEISSFRKMHPY
jgi:glycine dehydrogenase